MWRELIASLESDPIFLPPTTAEAIADAEQKLNVVFPDVLKSLLLESDGVESRLTVETNGLVSTYDDRMLWSVEEIVRLNLEQRHGIYSDNAPFETLLFFADAGNGDQFAYSIADGKAVGACIWLWNHEDDSRRVFAPSLQGFLEGWLSGALAV